MDHFREVGTVVKRAGTGSGDLDQEYTPGCLSILPFKDHCAHHGLDLTIFEKNSKYYIRLNKIQRMSRLYCGRGNACIIIMHKLCAVGLTTNKLA